MEILLESDSESAKLTGIGFGIKKSTGIGFGIVEGGFTPGLLMSSFNFHLLNRDSHTLFRPLVSIRLTRFPQTSLSFGSLHI